MDSCRHDRAPWLYVESSGHCEGCITRSKLNDTQTSAQLSSPEHTHSLFDGIPLIHPSLVWSISNPIETSNWIDWIWKCASLRALQASIQICPLASHRVWRACDSCPGYAHSWSDLFGSVVCYYPTNTHTHSLSALGNHHQVAALTGCCAW